MADPAAFESLLQRLQADDPSPEQAYERLRFRLITFLRVRLPSEAEAEALADIALDRLARRIHDGTVVEGVPQYVLGIARLLVKETEARAAAERKRSAAFVYEQSTASAAVTSIHADDEAQETVMRALAACLETLPLDARNLVLSYYGGDGSARIAHRHALAVRLGLEPNALRNRALRARMRLEKCVTSRLGPATDTNVTLSGKTTLTVVNQRERSK